MVRLVPKVIVLELKTRQRYINNQEMKTAFSSLKGSMNKRHNYEPEPGRLSLPIVYFDTSRIWICDNAAFGNAGGAAFLADTLT